MKKDIVVYWSPVWDDPKYWSLLYKDPESVTKDLVKNKVKEIPSSNYLKCPAHIDYFRNTYMLKTVLPTDVNIINDEVVSIDNGNLGGRLGHKPTLQDRYLLHMFMGWIFFTENESLQISVTPPFFHETEHSKYGSLVPGGFDIGKWFRPVQAEYQLWKGVDRFVMKKNEPMLYLKFHTEDNIVLQKFHLNETLDSIRKHIQDSSFWEPKTSLSERYQQFKDARLKSLVLKEIKANLY